MFGKKGSKKTNKVEPKPAIKSLNLLEPFQEAIDEAMEVDWLELENHDFPLSEVGADKSTASQAVALVIRASRRGVVSLCAEVADLLKENNRMESVIEEQRDEMASLMRNQLIPRSPSPPPPETTDFSMQTVQEMECQTTQFIDSSSQTESLVLPCAQIKSLDENDKTVVRTTDLSGVEFECRSKFTVQCTCPRMMTSSTQNPVKISIGTNTGDNGRLNSDHGYFEHNRLDNRLKNLEAKHKTLKAAAKGKATKTTNLEFELATAKDEIVSLQKAIQDLQTKDYEKMKEEERMKMTDSFSLDVQDNRRSTDSESTQGDERNMNIVIMEGKKRREIFAVASGKPTVSMRSSIFPGPILGCKCQMCTAFFRSSGILGFACTPYVTDSSGKNPVLKDLRKLISLQNSKLQIHPSDKVLLHNRKTGIVRYIGHLDSSGLSSVVYAGIELDEATGKHDGFVFGKRYFFAPKNHGMFLPLQDIICTINKQVALPEVRRRHSVVNRKKYTSTADGAVQLPKAGRQKTLSSWHSSGTTSPAR